LTLSGAGVNTGNPTGDMLKQQSDLFTQQTGIKVDIEEVKVEDLAKAFEAASLAGQERDLVVLNLTPDTSGWLTGGQVADVKKYLDAWGLTDELEPAALKFWTEPEGIAGFPFTGFNFNWPIWYNMDLLAKAGVTTVPATTDALIDTAKMLRAAGIQPMALGGGDWPAQNFMYWMVEQYVKPDAVQPLFSKGGFCANPDAVKGLDLLGQLRDAGVFIDNVQGFSNDQMVTTYVTGKAAMMPAGSWSYTAPARTRSPHPPSWPASRCRPVGSTPSPLGRPHQRVLAVPQRGQEDRGRREVPEVHVLRRQPEGLGRQASQIMSVKPSVLGDVKAGNPLVQKGLTEVTAQKVDFMILPDAFIPTGYDFDPGATEFLGHKGETGAQYCKAIDKVDSSQGKG
jgi:multiple sugar transport system substrate-binding protein